MIVMEGESFPLTDGKWKKLELSVDNSDLEKLLAEWGVDPYLTQKLSPTLSYDILSVLAEQLIVLRAFTAHAYTQDEAQQRLSELAERVVLQKAAVLSLEDRDGKQD